MPLKELGPKDWFEKKNRPGYMSCTSNDYNELKKYDDYDFNNECGITPFSQHKNFFDNKLNIKNLSSQYL